LRALWVRLVNQGGEGGREKEDLDYGRGGEKGRGKGKEGFVWWEKVCDKGRGRKGINGDQRGREVAIKIAK